MEEAPSTLSKYLAHTFFFLKKSSGSVILITDSKLGSKKTLYLSVTKFMAGVNSSYTQQIRLILALKERKYSIDV